MPDLFEPTPPSADDEKPGPLRTRLLWFFVFAAGGLIAVAGAAYLMRALLFLN